MNQSALRKIFLILSLLGILILIILAQTIKPSTLQQPEKLTDSMPSILEGKIKSINPNPKSTSIYLENSSVEIVIISNQILNLKENQMIEVYGKAQQEKNKTSLIADKIVTH